MKNFDSELYKIIIELEKYYESDLSEAEDSAENARIKECIFSLIREAHISGSFEAKEKLLSLLSENVGCQEDIELVEEFSKRLIDEGVLTPMELEKHFSEFSTARWH
ncbi:hypothetical protein [Andreprevotia lacus]|jgi:predicted DNA-binding protein YlxM (UPF0122 family)|uniref:hypothetical protein n=1 Tax=Andreprevotia lacus TaxID=1121000 RepID=UPI000A06BED8|nr:hypothetical protein [Andreprevotia lacus]